MARSPRTAASAPPPSGDVSTAPVAETPLALTRRARKIVRLLGQAYPDAFIELDFSTPLELAVATVLAAQNTDKKINEITPALFARYPDARAYAEADRSELETLIKQSGFFRAKANSLITLGQALVERYDGELPATMAELLTLPGFGRKTASVVLGNAFGVPAIAVDTHVTRMVERWRWSAEKDPVKIERDIAALIPRKDWTATSNRATWHGRRVCHARNPACGACVIASSCPSFGLGETDPVRAEKLLKGPVQPAR